MESKLEQYKEYISQNLEYICDNWVLEFQNNYEVETLIDNQNLNDVDLVFKEIRLSINN